MDGEDNSWVGIDTRVDNTEADLDHPIVTFPVTHSESFRFIRLRQTGKNALGYDHLILFGFELFGLLID
jgi:hypothetical protein